MVIVFRFESYVTMALAALHALMQMIVGEEETVIPAGTRITKELVRGRGFWGFR
jgi:hypothetical protein